MFLWLPNENGIKRDLAAAERAHENTQRPWVEAGMSQVYCARSKEQEIMQGELFALKCPNCGAEINPKDLIGDARFCWFCGTIIYVVNPETVEAEAAC